MAGLMSQNIAKTLLRMSYVVTGNRIWVEVQGTATHVHGIQIDVAGGKLSRQGRLAPVIRMGRLAYRQLQAYFLDATPLKLPLWDHADSSNQVVAMRFLRGIPSGMTRSYAQQAAAVRRVARNGFNPRNAGTANHNNRYPLVIPCHRIVRGTGDVGGFMGSGREPARTLKQALLAHEARFAHLGKVSNLQS